MHKEVQTNGVHTDRTVQITVHNTNSPINERSAPSLRPTNESSNRRNVTSRHATVQIEPNLSVIESPRSAKSSSVTLSDHEVARRVVVDDEQDQARSMPDQCRVQALAISPTQIGVTDRKFHILILAKFCRPRMTAETTVNFLQIDPVNVHDASNRSSLISGSSNQPSSQIGHQDASSHTSHEHVLSNNVPEAQRVLIDASRTQQSENTPILHHDVPLCSPQRQSSSLEEKNDRLMPLRPFHRQKTVEVDDNTTSQASAVTVNASSSAAKTTESNANSSANCATRSYNDSSNRWTSIPTRTRYAVS